MVLPRSDFEFVRPPNASLQTKPNVHSSCVQVHALDEQLALLRATGSVVGSTLVSEIEKAPSIDAAALALGNRIRALKEAARHGLSRREVAP